MEDALLRELQSLVEACQRRGIEAYVIGAWSVYAYGSLLRQTLDLDFALERDVWPALVKVLEEHGYQVAPAGIWVTATKGEGEETIEIHIALDEVTDMHSALSYPVHVEPGTQQSVPGIAVPIPVFTLEGLLITKLIALRDNDVVDIVALLTQHAPQLNADRFWNQAALARLDEPLMDRLVEVEEMLTSGEADAIWWDRLGLALAESEHQGALQGLRHLQAQRSDG